MTATTDDGDDRRRPSTAIKSRPLILLKILDFRKIVSFFEKQRKSDFFQRSLPWTKKGNDDRRRRRPTTATTDDGDDRRWLSTAKKSRPLILLKILDFRKIVSFFEKQRKSDFFQRSLPWTKKWKWRTTATTDDGDDRRRPSTAIKSRPLILLKILDFRKIVSFFEKQRKSDFFQRSLPWTKKWKWRTTATTDDGDDRRRPSTAIKSRPLILLKILDFRKIVSFFEKQRKSDFFQRSLPWTKKWKWRMTATTDDGDDRRRPSTAIKSRPLILLKILDFRKIVSFWKNSEKFDFFPKTAKIWFFSKVPPLDEKAKNLGNDGRPWTKKGNDGRRRRPTTATTDDGRWRRKNLVHSFC